MDDFICASQHNVVDLDDKMFVKLKNILPAFHIFVKGNIAKGLWIYINIQMFNSNIGQALHYTLEYTYDIMRNGTHSVSICPL